jgi:hypothetical protein
MKALKITFSGSYKASNDEIFNFDGISGIVPFQEEDVAIMHAKTRHLPMWLEQEIKGDKQANISVKGVKQLRDKNEDEIEEVEREFSFEGKDIRALNQEEIQDVALMFDLREVPLYKVSSLKNQLNVLYGIYSTQVLKEPIDHKAEFFSYKDMPPIFLRSTSSVKREIKPIFKEEDGAPVLQTKSLEALKAIAEQKGIKFHHRIGYDRLVELINAFDNPSVL